MIIYQKRLFFKRKANAFSLNAIVDVCCHHEIIFFKYLGNY